jgi:hypothetical protein
VHRVLAFLLAMSLPLAGADHAILNLKVVEGDGIVYALGSRASRGITVEVTDESARPVSGVSVSFQLPDDGPTGVFVNGGRSDVVTTRQDGRAAVWGMKWNNSPGRLNVRVVAAKGGLRAGLLVLQVLDASLAEPAMKSRGGGRSRILLITAVIAGAAGAGLAVAGSRGSKSSAAAAVQPLSIGTPTVIIGAP